MHLHVRLVSVSTLVSAYLHWFVLPGDGRSEIELARMFVSCSCSCSISEARVTRSRREQVAEHLLTDLVIGDFLVVGHLTGDLHRFQQLVDTLEQKFLAWNRQRA